MGSIGAMKKGSKDRYFQDVEDDLRKLVPEGIEGRVPFKGFLSEVVHQMNGGLKAAMGYCGAANIKELKKAEFVQISAASYRRKSPSFSSNYKLQVLCLKCMFHNEKLTCFYPVLFSTNGRE